MFRGRLAWGFACVLLLSQGPALRAQLNNGGFETGDTSGWAYTVYPDALFGDPGSGPIINTSWSNMSPTGRPTNSKWYPAGGRYFATLILGAPRQLASETFTVEQGDVLSFDYFFDYGDSQPSFPDSAYGLLIEADGDPLHTFFEWNMGPESLLSTGAEIPWVTLSHVFSTAGAYQLLFGVTNPTDFDRCSILGVDNVELTAPEPGTVMLLLAAASMGLRRRRFIFP